ncbi:MAG: thymidine kinase [Firmicutes bacterium]|nr:thymidine kinase [Bacillota bacterium]
MSKIYFRYGAMNCGKTTALLQVAHNYEEKGMKILLIKPAVDKKGDKNIVSRLGIERKVDILLDSNEKLKHVLKLDNINCILVDEVQFMTKEQIKELWIIAKMKDIPVICYGLKTNFKGKLFEGSKALLEVADELEELITICKCGKRAKFNARLENGKYVSVGEEVAIDGIDAKYEPLCGKCYIENVLGIDSF